MQRPWRTRTTALAITLTAGLTSSLLAVAPAALAVGEPERAASSQPAGTPQTVEGVIRLLVADPVAPVAGVHEDDYRQVLVVGSTSYFLAGAQGEPNTRARVTGVSNGRTLTATRVETLGPAAGTIPTKGTTRVLVLLAEWSQPDSETPASVAEQMFEDSNAWYRDASYGALGQKGDVTPWMEIDGPVDGKCYADSENIMSQAKESAVDLGYDLAEYDNYVMYFPNNGWQEGSDCNGFGGWAYVGAPNAWINGYMDRRVTVHEEGHNYGLSHSHSYLCDRVVLGECTWSDYGDDFDAMGASGLVGHFSASQKNLLDWMDERLVDLTGAGSVTLAPYASDAVTTTAAVVYASPTRSYWLEYRQRLDFDSTLPPAATDGVLVHVVDRTISNDDGSNLIDTRPKDGVGVYTATLRSGDEWKTPEGYTLGVDTVSEDGADVTVSGGPTCKDESSEPDDDATQAPRVELPSKTPHAFCSADDEDWVKFEAEAGGVYRIWTIHLSEGNDTVLDLYAADGTTVLETNDDRGDSRASLIRFKPKTSGTYYAAARNYDGEAGLFLTYRLRVSEREAPQR